MENMNVMTDTGVPKRNVTERELQLDEALRRMQADVEELITLSPEDRLYWKSPKIDLIEMLHTVFTSGGVTDDHGRPATFRWMVQRVCRNLHVTPPANPFAMASAARNRKGVRQSPFIERYRWALFETGTRRPLQMDIILKVDGGRRN